MYFCIWRQIISYDIWFIILDFFDNIEDRLLKGGGEWSFKFHEKQKCICNQGSHFQKDVICVRVVP